MKLLKIICCITMCCLCATAHAYSLHVGDGSFLLNQNKYTSPALAAFINGVTFYGALYLDAAPDKTLHVQHNGNVYWLGQSCQAGMYSETGASTCTGCTIGHYCPGGAFRVPCTYGAISCNRNNLAIDMPAPINAPVNKFMTLDEVNEFIPITDFSDWRQISCCWLHKTATVADLETMNDVRNACASGTIGPGTYLFLARYNMNTNGYDSINGQSGQISNAHIAVFDHPVSYASMHGNSVFQHFVDLEHENYTQRSISSTPIVDWYKNINETNISNLTNFPNGLNLCVYELK